MAAPADHSGQRSALALVVNNAESEMNEAKSMGKVWRSRLAPYVRSLSDRRLARVMALFGTTGTHEHITNKRRRTQSEILWQIESGQLTPDQLYAAAESI